MLDFISQIIYNNKELKGEDDGDESLNNSPPKGESYYSPQCFKM